MKPTVFLFDIDGTLITTGGAGRRAIERAFQQVYGRPDAVSGISFGGMTDPAILRAGLLALGYHEGNTILKEAMDILLNCYLSVLAEEVEQAANYWIHEGVTASLDRLEGRPEFAVGLGTGNIREGARIKLSKVSLFDRFGFGGFGCDSEDRAELLRAGARRGAETLRVPLSQCRVVIIGDTPKDIAAAHAMGAECLAVATGFYSLETLLECKPALAVSNLNDTKAISFLLEPSR